MRRSLLAAALTSITVLCACGAEDPITEQPPVNTDPTDPVEQEEVVEASPTLQAALADFGACMSLEVWIKTDIYSLYKAEDEEGRACMSCHSDLTGGSGWSDDIDWTFEVHRKLPAIMRLVTGTVDERGNFKDLVAANRYNEKGVDTCPEGYECHPQYTLPAHLQTAVAEFVSESLDRWHNGTCNAPYAPNNQDQ